jgi:L-threonylcarbamoyladenylate synthase
MATFDSLVLQPDEAGFQRAAELLREGKLVAFPTETVYGLGGNALDVVAANAIFEAKGRPTTDPLIVHIGHISDAKALTDMNEQERQAFEVLGTTFWPGPLTIIVRAAACVPGVVTAFTGMVGIRCPNHPIALRLLQQSGLPIAAPSANRFGHVSPTRVEHVLDDLGDKNVHVLSGDSIENLSVTCQHGIESTVVKVDSATSRLLVLREGAVTRARIAAALRSVPELQSWTVEVVVRRVNMHEVKADTSTSPDASSSIGAQGEVAPGQAVTHYAPNLPCRIITQVIMTGGTSGNLANEIFRTEEFSIKYDDLGSVVIIDFAGKLSSLKSQSLSYCDLSTDGDTSVAARGLFAALRWAENVIGAKAVFLADVVGDSSEASPEFLDSLGPGLADRMNRAASGARSKLLCRIDL